MRLSAFGNQRTHITSGKPVELEKKQAEINQK